MTVSDDVIRYDRYNDELMSDASSTDSVICDYTFQPSEAEFPAYFKQTLVFELASLFAGAIARNDNLSDLYHKRSLTQMAVAKSVDAQAQTVRRLDINRFREARNRTGLNNITATVQS